MVGGGKKSGQHFGARMGGPILAQQVHEKQSFCTYMLPHPLLIE